MINITISISSVLIISGWGICGLATKTLCLLQPSVVAGRPLRLDKVFRGLCYMRMILLMRMRMKRQILGANIQLYYIRMRMRMRMICRPLRLHKISKNCLTRKCLEILETPVVLLLWQLVYPADRTMALDAILFYCSLKVQAAHGYNCKCISWQSHCASSPINCYNCRYISWQSRIKKKL